MGGRGGERREKGSRKRVLSVSTGLFALNIIKFNQYQEIKLGAGS